MFKLRSVSGRIAIGKLIGLVVGILIIVLLPLFSMPLFSMVGFGVLIMFILMGAMIGFLGQFDRHPMLDFRMKWWFRGPLVGIVFMLMFVLMSYEIVDAIMQSAVISWTGLESPFWALVDGVIIGGIMGWLETKFAGEGKDLPLV